MNNSPLVLIMAGGTGTRFWPASRDHCPKQFLDISGAGKTLIHMTFERFASFVPLENIFVITHENYKEQTLKALPELLHTNLFTEPSRNNTAAAIALSSFKLHKINPDAVCIVAPSDHLIKNDKEFQKVIAEGCEYANAHKSILTLGITPNRPDTGYGYIEFDPHDGSSIRKVISFREKPDLHAAQHFIDSGHFVWNAGIFIWKLNTILDSFKTHAQEIYNLLQPGVEVFNTEAEMTFVKKHYPDTEKISVDFAILEKARNVFTIPCDIGWSDLGTWTSLYDESNKDAQQNAVLSTPVYIEDTHRSLILSETSKLIVIKGLEDYIIVDTNDCLMIYPKSEEQTIKDLKDKLRLSGLDNYL